MIKRPVLALSILAFGLAFLYVPIVSVIVYSFNESRLVTVWAGFSLKWWRELPDNEAVLDATLVSLQVALVSSTLALILGTMAGMALARYRRFPGRTLFAGLVAAPLVMPEVIMGISTLLLFVLLERVIGWPERGITTVTIAHATFTMAFVAVVVQARLAQFDRSLEEAAADLGARPITVFFTVTLPIIAPALASGWLLAFTLSLDDVVITQFVTGPSATTLPILVYSSVRRGVSPEINVIATVLIAIVALFVVISAFILRRTQKRAAQAS